MRQFHLRSLWFRRTAMPLTAMGLLAFSTIPVRAATSVTTADYDVCAQTLIAGGISAEAAAAACAASLYPQDLVECVAEIDLATDLPTENALAACRRVRRPVEMSQCVNQIATAGLPDGSAQRVLDGCRRSLLPDRYSDCVVGLALSAELTLDSALSTCIAAGDRPQNVLPSFILGDPLPPIVAPSGQSAPVQSPQVAPLPGAAQ